MNKKVRILQIIHGMYLGGAENVVFNIIKKIDTEKYEIVLCCTHGAGELGERLIDEGYSVEVFERGIGAFQTFKRIKAHIKKVEPDIVHTHGVSAFLAVGPLYLWNKLPPWIHTFHFGNYPHIQKSYLYGQMIFARFAKKLIAVSESQRNAVIEHLRVKPKQISTVFNGVPNNPCVFNDEVRKEIRDEFNFSDTDLVFSCIVVFTEQKGVNYLLQAVDKVVESAPNAKFLIVGGGPLDESLRNQASQLKHSDSVVFAGWRQDIHQIMTAIDVFVLPSLWEGLPMVLLEAMASARPVVVTDVADNLNVVGQGEAGYVVPPKDTKALEEAILKLALNEDDIQSMGKAALARYESQYTVDKMVQGYEKVYTDILIN